VDPWDGPVLTVENALTAPSGTRAFNILYPIRIGRWGGGATRILHALLGLSPLVLFLTGAVMWWNRVQVPRVAEAGIPAGRGTYGWRGTVFAAQ
jgi:uncharacterized iron-regulated membrane protein